MAGKLINFILSADSSKFRVGLEAARAEARRSTKDIGDQFGNLNRTLGRVGGVVLGLAGAGGFLALSRQVLNNAAAFADLAQQTGETSETLSTLSAVALQNGATQAALERSLRRVARGLKQIETGGGPLAKQLEDIGVSAFDSSGRLRGAYDVLLDVADVFAGLPDGVEKTAIAYELLGQTGQEMIPTLNLGREGLIDQQEAMKALGFEIDTTTADAASRFNNAMQALGWSVQAVVREAIEPMLPVLSGLTEDMGSATSEARRFASILGQAGALIVKGFVGAVTTARSSVRQLVILVAGGGRALAAALRGDFAGAAREAEFAMSELRREGDEWRASLAELVSIEERGTKAIDEQTAARARSEEQQQRNLDRLRELRKRNEELAQAEKDRQRLAEQVRTQIENMKRELSLVHATTNAERLRYEVTRGAYRDADAASKARILQLADELDREEAIKKAREEARRQAEQQAKELEALTQKFVESTRTELELLEKERAQLESIRHLIDDETYTRALADIEKRIRLTDKATREWAEFTEQAAKNIQDAFADFLFDPFQDGLKGMVRGFADTVRRMIAELLAQRLLRSFFTSVGGTGFAASMGFAQGGMVYGPGTATSDSIPARLSAGEFVQPAAAVRHYGADFMEAVRRRELPRFARGGLVRGGPSVARFAEGGPVIGQTGGESGGGVRIINTVDPDIVADYLASASGERVIVNTIRRNSSAVRNALG